MAALENKIDFAVVFASNNANPNGDPLNGNRPRTTSEGLGEVSDVALKRKIRNRLQDAGETIFVQSDDRSDDGAKSLSDRFNTYLKTLPKEEQKQKNLVFQKVCEQWLDVRAFGQVFAFKKAKDVDEVSLGVRGPVSIQAAFSVEPIAIDDVQITKSVNSETTDTGKKSSDTMGMKYRVSGRAVYATYGSISPQLAEKTGFTAEDAEKSRKLSSRCLRMMKVRLVLRGPWKCWTLCGSRTTASQGNTLPPKFIVPFPLMWTERWQ